MPELVDMCLYKDDGTPVYPPDDLEPDRVKSCEGDDGEWRLVTVQWPHVFSAADKHNKDSLVKGYGRVTVLAQYPSEAYFEFAFWNVPAYDTELPADEQPLPDWEVRDVHWEHTWQDFDHGANFQ